MQVNQDVVQQVCFDPLKKGGCVSLFECRQWMISPRNTPVRLKFVLLMKTSIFFIANRTVICRNIVDIMGKCPTNAVSHCIPPAISIATLASKSAWLLRL
jgi:hypothetical protein